MSDELLFVVRWVCGLRVISSTSLAAADKLKFFGHSSKSALGNRKLAIVCFTGPSLYTSPSPFHVANTECLSPSIRETALLSGNDRRIPVDVACSLSG